MAQVLEGWELGPPPMEGAVATFYLDAGEAWLCWIDPSTGEPAPSEVDGEIPWPFREEVVRRTELLKLGFKDAEDYPEGG